MNKKDSSDFTSRLKLLLKIMTNGCAKDSQNSEDSDYSVSSNESEVESEENDVSDLGENENDSDITFDLNKFFEDHIESTKKCTTSSINCNAEKKIQFEEKMYRVVPIKLDKKIFKFKNPVAKNRK